MTVGAESIVAGGKCGANGDNLTWTLDSDGTLIISGTGEMLSASGNNNSPFYDYASDIKKIVIEDGVSSIGERAFSGCKNLISVTIPDSVTSIGSQAFYGCSSLPSIVLPDSVTIIESLTFYECTSLTDVTLGDNVTQIRQRAFQDCKFPSIFAGQRYQYWR